jgi:hypothetical protein
VSALIDHDPNISTQACFSKSHLPKSIGVPGVLFVGTFASFALLTRAPSNIEIKQIVLRNAVANTSRQTIDAEHVLEAVAN